MLMFFGDVIFPALTAREVPVFFPWIIPLALAAETAVFFAFYRELTAWRIITLVLGANAFSWLVGILFGVLVPLAFEIYPVQSQLHAGHGALIQFLPEVGFVIALGVSIFIEYLVWAVVSHRQPPPMLLRSVTAANAASYAVVVLSFVLSRATGG